MCVLLVVLGYKNLDFRTYLDQKSILFLWSKALMISMLSAIFFFLCFLDCSTIYVCTSGGIRV